MSEYGAVKGWKNRIRIGVSSAMNESIWKAGRDPLLISLSVETGVDIEKISVIGSRQPVSIVEGVTEVSGSIARNLYSKNATYNEFIYVNDSTHYDLLKATGLGGTEGLECKILWNPVSDDIDDGYERVITSVKFHNYRIAHAARDVVAESVDYDASRLKILRGNRQMITILGTSEALHDYQVKIELNSSNFDFDSSSDDGSDIHFVDNSDNELPFWIESWNDDHAIIWCKIPVIPAGGNVYIWMIYGDTGPHPNSSGDATFDLFDDFSGDIIDSAKWSIHKRGSSNAKVELDGSGNLHLAGEPNTISSGNLRSVSAFTSGFAVRLEHKMDAEHFADVSIGSGNLQDLDDGGDSKWWHTVLGDGYSFIWQSPVSGEASMDMRIDRCPEGTSATNLAYLNIANLVSLDKFMIEEARYAADGKLEFCITPDSRAKLETPTYDGSGQAIHPDVVYFENGWNGYKYWMAMTPYPNSNNAYENPSILASSDEYNWVEPDGITNPVEPAPAVGYNSDPDMIYNDDSDELWLYFRYTNQSQDIIYLKKSSDGIHWSDKTNVLESSFASLLSPAVIKESGKYYMWVVDKNPSPYQLKLYESTDGENFSLNTSCLLDYTPSGKDIWHVDVIKVNSEYWGLFTFCDAGAATYGGRNYFAKSTDKVNWHVQEKILIDVRSGYWDSDIIYRGSLLYSEPYLKIWYSARDSQEWHTGYAESEYIDGDWILVSNKFLKKILEASDTIYRSENKNVLLSQGEHSNGWGGNRYIDYIFVRRYTSPEPKVII